MLLWRADSQGVVRLSPSGAHLLFCAPTPKKSSQGQQRACLELTCAVFEKGEKCHIESITKKD